MALSDVLNVANSRYADCRYAERRGAVFTGKEEETKTGIACQDLGANKKRGKHCVCVCVCVCVLESESVCVRENGYVRVCVSE